MAKTFVINEMFDSLGNFVEVELSVQDENSNMEHVITFNDDTDELLDKASALEDIIMELATVLDMPVVFREEEIS